MKRLSFKPPLLAAIVAGDKTVTRRIARLEGRPGAPWKAGEVLAVTEPWCPECDDLGFKTGRFLYQRDHRPGDKIQVRDGQPVFRADGQPASPWRSGRFMPTEAIRTFLLAREVGCERLHAMPWQEVHAEGLVARVHLDENLGYCPVSALDGVAYPDLRSLWVSAWESIHGEGSWAENPWVWVIRFSLSERPKAVSPD